MNNKKSIKNHLDTKKVILGLGILTGWLLCGTLTVAQAETSKVSILSLDIAEKMANGAMKKCREDGYKVSVVVVDREGVVIVEIRNELAGPHTLSSSFRKAFTAGSLGRSTQDLVNLIKDKPDLVGMRNMDDRILILAGGLPIKIDNELVGGLGVGGAPGGNLDEACAKAGLDSIGHE